MVIHQETHRKKTKICAYGTISCLREDTVISLLGSHVFYVSKKHSTVVAFCNLSDIKKKVTYSLKS